MAAKHVAERKGSWATWASVGGPELADADADAEQDRRLCCKKHIIRKQVVLTAPTETTFNRAYEIPYFMSMPVSCKPASHRKATKDGEETGPKFVSAMVGHIQLNLLRRPL